MQLKNIFRCIHANTNNLVHGAAPPIEISTAHSGSFRPNKYETVEMARLSFPIAEASIALQSTGLDDVAITLGEVPPMATTSELADKIAAEHSLTKGSGKAIVEAVFAASTAAATSGAETSIPGFGKFKVKDPPEQEARNPVTGATIKVAITAVKKLSFSPAKALNDTLNK